MKYPFFRIGSSRFCVYCGDHAESSDHVIPVSYQTIIEHPSDRLTGFGPIAYCCTNCNTALGNLYFDSFQSRCDRAHDLLVRRLKPILWTKGEIQKLDVSLQRYVEREQTRRAWNFQRADWFQSRDYYLNLESLLWEPCLNPTSKTYHKELYSYFNNTLHWVRALYRF